MSDQKEYEIPATHIGAQPPPGTDPIGGGFSQTPVTFPNNGHFGFQPAVGKVLNNLTKTVKALAEEYKTLSERLPHTIEQELAATRLKNPTNSLPPAAAIMYELDILSKVLLRKTAELHNKSAIANKFYGADPINTPLQSFYKKALTLEKSVKPNGIAMQAWQTSYRAAHDARLLSQSIQLLNEQSVNLQNRLRAVQEEDQARLAAQLAAAEQARIAAEAEAQRLAAEQARVAAEAEAHRLAAEQIRVAAEAEAHRLAELLRLEREQQTEKQAQEQAPLRPRSFTKSGSMAVLGPVFTATAGSIIANPATSLALKIALRAAVSSAIGMSVTAVPPIIVGLAALLVPSRLGNSDLYSVSVPLSELAPDFTEDLHGLAAAQGEVTLRVTLGLQTIGSLTQVVVATTDGVSIPSNIPLQLAQFDPEKKVYVSTSTGPQPVTITWTPVVESPPQSTESPVAEIDVPIYEGATVTPVEGRIDTSPQLDQYSFGGFITVFPAESGIPPLYVVFNSPYDGATVTGEYSGRDYNPDQAGGAIQDLEWSSAILSQEGIDRVKLHTSRLAASDANTVMIERLEKILEGKLNITDVDKRYYTHEIRELDRFRALGYSDTETPKQDSPTWNNAHTATLEDYKVRDDISLLYTEEALAAADEQDRNYYQNLLREIQ